MIINISLMAVFYVLHLNKIAIVHRPGQGVTVQQQLLALVFFILIYIRGLFLSFTSMYISMIEGSLEESAVATCEYSLLKAASFLVEPRRFMGVRGSTSRSSSGGGSTAVGVAAPDIFANSTSLHPSTITIRSRHNK